jgi:hypothetical protein
MLHNFFIRKSCRLWYNMEKYCRVRQATDDTVAYSHFMLSTYGYKYTLTICNTYCFSAATMIARTPLSIRLDVHGLPCYAAVWTSLSLSLSLYSGSFDMELSTDVTVVLHDTTEIFMGHCFTWFYTIHIVVLRRINICYAGRLTS